MPIGDDGASEPESNEDGLIVENGDGESVAAAILLVSQNPLKLFELHCNGKAKGKAECGVLIEYLQSIFALPSCFSKYNRHFTACSCLRNLQENVIFDSIADRLSE